MAMALGSGGGPKSDINITPYIDILLVLLIIFMVIQPKTQYDLKARVPQKPPEEIEQNVIIKSDAIVVSLDSTGSLRINTDPVTLDQLGSRLFDIYSARANKNMFIQGDPDLPFGDIVRIIDIAKGAGVGDIGLMTPGGG
ncbi:MAG TPA: biopolymer transporter ExbD [Acidobacteriota bacterium]|nr:biopolymer transporter ExbD [Acidobacteriota bacterium]